MSIDHRHDCKGNAKSEEGDEHRSTKGIYESV